MGENSRNASAVGAWPSGVGSTNRNDAFGEQASKQQFAITDDENIYQTSPQIKIDYDEVFPEPEIYEGYFSIRKVSRTVYLWTQIAVYIIFSILFGIILSFLWGFIMAIVNFFSVYVMQPTSKVVFVILRSNAMMYRAAVRTYLDPLYESFGLFFSRITGRFFFNATAATLPTIAKTGQATIKEA